MATGTVKFFSVGRAYGFIVPDEGDQDVHVKWSAIEGDGYVWLANGERVEFDLETGDRGPEARRVRSLGDRLCGVVETWDLDKGQGRLIPDGEGTGSLFFHWNNVLTAGGRARLDEGERVSFEIEENEKGRRAIRVKRADPREPLRRFAHLPDDDVWTEELATLAEPEDWNRYGEPEDDGRRPILVSYLMHTFARLEEEERQQQQNDKLAMTEHDGNTWAAFNTGLVTPRQEEIFGLLKEFSQTDVWRFDLVDFCRASDPRMVDIFGGQMPDLAQYVGNPAELIFDPDLDLVVNTVHIVEHNLDRFPEKYRQDSYAAEQAIEGQLARLKRRARRNYKTAVPHFYNGHIKLLLPLHLSHPETADLALVVERHGNCYRGTTVLPLQWAYKAARLLTRPDPDWLVPATDD